jgi:hypothetical protein
MKKSADKLATFVADQGKSDRLDKEPIFPVSGGEELGPMVDEEDRKDLQVIKDRLQALSDRMLKMADESAEYTVEQLDEEIRQIYTAEVLENNPALKFRLRNRMNRFVGKILVPINEANCRGVTQSSIWGCMVGYRPIIEIRNQVHHFLRFSHLSHCWCFYRLLQYGHAKAAKSRIG